MPGCLDGVRIVDLTAVVSGPFATAILGDMGADVIKVEPPGPGDIARYYGPAKGPGMAASFMVMNRNKRGIIIDLQKPDGKDVLMRLVAGADVVLQNYRPGVVDRLGVGYDGCRKVKDDIIYVSISGFGDDGPYAANRVYDPVIQAVSGYMGCQTDPDTGQPAPVRNIICDKVTSMTVVQGVLAALYARERGAGGQHVKLSMLDAGLGFLWSDGMCNHTWIEPAPRTPEIGDLYNVAPTKDGHVTWIASSDDEYQGLCTAIGRPEMKTDARFTKIIERVQNIRELQKLVSIEVSKFTTAETVARFGDNQVPCAKINQRADLLNDPQIKHNKSIIEGEHAQMGRLRYARPPIQFSKTPSSVRRQAPQAGRDTDEVLREVGISADELATLRAKGAVA